MSVGAESEVSLGRIETRDLRELSLSGIKLAAALDKDIDLPIPHNRPSSLLSCSRPRGYW
jgi:hypothetical protein